MDTIETEEIEQIETVEIRIDSLLRVLAGRRENQRPYTFSAFPPLEETTTLIEVFNDQQEAEVYPVVEPDELVNRTGHEPHLVDSVDLLFITDDDELFTHEVDVRVIREDYDDEWKCFLRDWNIEN